jgi:hypothetical protein
MSTPVYRVIVIYKQISESPQQHNGMRAFMVRSASKKYVFGYITV